MSTILSYFDNLTLTNDQQRAALAIEQFLVGDDSIFLLKGYAGTGKTTLLSGICRYITSQDRGVLLMAPTGRAAQVMNSKTSLPATTIHKGIYSFHQLDTVETTGEEGQETFQFIYQLRTDADILSQVFIVDEGSMVSDNETESEFFRFGSGRVLLDMLQFSKIGQPNVRTQLIVVGDPAQLPPVGMAFSPALDEKYLADTYKLTIITAELQEVVRQGGQSGVLELATQVRHCITANRFTHFAIADNVSDVRTLTWAGFMLAYQQANARRVVICYTNKKAKDLSERIRMERFGPKAAPLEKGDLIVVGMNNFKLGVMNGTFGMIAEVTDRVIERAYTINRKTGPVSGTFRWRWIEVMFKGENNRPYTVATWLLENFLLSDHSRLGSVESQALYVDFVIRYGSQSGRKPNFTKTPEFSESLKNDEFFNALMVKYGYAVTCHKAQGSEWPDVFLCFDYSKTPDFNPYQDSQTEKGLTNSDFFRWAYTAITRASGRLLALNPPQFSVFSKLSWIDTSLAAQFMATEGVEPEVIVWNTEEDRWLEQLGLTLRNESIQQKLIEIRHRLQPVDIQILCVIHKPFQEHLTLEQTGKTTRAVLYFNGSNQLKSHMMLGGDSALSKLADDLISKLGPVVIEREVSSDQAQEPINYQPAVSQPQLRILFDQISQYTLKNCVSVVSVTPMAYRERYVFKRGAERAIVDYVYDDKGFFKEARPLANQCKGQQLMADLQQFTSKLSR